MADNITKLSTKVMGIVNEYIDAGMTTEEVLS